MEPAIVKHDSSSVPAGSGLRRHGMMEEWQVRVGNARNSWGRALPGGDGTEARKSSQKASHHVPGLETEGAAGKHSHPRASPKDNRAGNWQGPRSRRGWSGRDSNGCGWTTTTTARSLAMLKSTIGEATTDIKQDRLRVPSHYGTLGRSIFPSCLSFPLVPLLFAAECPPMPRDGISHGG